MTGVQTCALPIWFFGVLLGTILVMVLGFLGIIFGDIVVMLKSGFSSTTIGFIFLFLSGIVFAITGWVPAFRRCYYKIPWLYPLCMILTMNLFIVSLAETILFKGFQVINTPRHIVTIIIMVVQIIACRLLMCFYLKKNPMILHKYDRDE